METLLNLRRNVFTNESTIGDLLVGDRFEAYTLEDSVRGMTKGKKAIPSGNYEVIINFSSRFKRPMPLLLGVPGFEGVRIHSGNTEKDTEGCILLGHQKFANQIGESRQAFEDFFPKLENALKLGKVFINIMGGKDPDIL